MFADRGSPPLLSTFWGGYKKGTCVIEHAAALSDNALVISDSGGLLAVGGLKAFWGAGRREGEGKKFHTGKQVLEHYGAYVDKPVAPRSPWDAREEGED